MFFNVDVFHPSLLLYDDVRCVVPADRFHVIPNGVPDPWVATMHKAESEGELPRIVFLSNMFVDKGPIDLLKASELLADAGFKHRLTFVGAATDVRVEQLIQEAKADNRRFIERLGGVYGEEKFRILRNATIFAFPSFYRYEVQPLSLIEAMALEVPIVASNFASIPEMIIDRTSGLLVPPRNVPALAAALTELLTNAELRKSLGVSARLRYEQHFTLNKFQENFVREIERI